jgi:CBS domain-containing protein
MMIMIQNILDRKGAKVFTIRATDTVQSAADRMHQHDVAALVVNSGDAIKGVISERDIVRAVSRHGAEHFRYRYWTSRPTPWSRFPPEIA